MGKKPNKQLKENDFAAIGIGVLLVFIAMVLVAGIAASVLVQTSTTLEMQALKTGQQTTSEVASGIYVEGIEGSNTSGSITLLAIEIKPRAGSPDIDLSQTVVEISDSETKYVLEYDSSTFTDSNATSGDIFTTGFYPTGSGSGSAITKFGIIVLQDADDSCTASNPVINFGDHVVISIGDAFSGISPRTDMFGQVISEMGAPGIIGFRTPESYTDPVLELQ
jgi:archaeal flagellin FlaB